MVSILNDGMIETPPVGDDEAPAPTADAPAAPSSTGKYVPPSMRGGAGAGRGGESMYRSRYAKYLIDLSTS